MSLVDRVKNILLKPKDEWEVIAGESATVGGLFTGYAIPLAVLPIIGGIVGMGVLGIGADAYAAFGGIGIGFAAALAAIGFVIGMLMLFIMAFVVNAISPSFNGKSDMPSAMKLMTYASTPSWVAGLIVPFLGMVGGVLSIAAIAYVVYLIYTGVRPVMEVPAEKVAGFTVVTILIYIVLSFILTAVIMGAALAAIFGGVMMAGAAGA
jgi:hypothetical protein